MAMPSSRRWISRILTVCFIVFVAANGRAEDVGRAKQKRLARNLLISGGVVLGAGYVASFGISLATLGVGSLCGTEPGNCRSQDVGLWGLLPVVGPWVQVGYFQSYGSGVATFAVPGVVQVVGLGLIIGGLVVRHKAQSESQSTLHSSMTDPITLQWRF